MVRNLFVLLLLAFFSSCENKPATPDEMLLGNWVEVKKKPEKGMPIIPEDTLAYTFRQDGVCEYKLGYLDYGSYMNDTLPTWERVVPYLGTETKYTLKDKNLKIYNLSDKKWDNYKIKQITADSLMISGETDILFVKKNYNVDNSPEFETVILSCDGCYGSCPVSNIIIDKNGTVLHNGDNHVKNKGHFKGQISKADFEKLILSFREADYLNLKSEYPLKFMHGSTTSLTFIKNGRILKSVIDNGTAPKEFCWAYRPLLYKEQQIPLKKVKEKDYLQLYHLRASFHDLGLYLDSNEVHYLFSRFELGKEVNKRINEKYAMTLYNNKLIDSVKTDGRYYKFYLRTGSSHTIDIGFNFLKANKNNKELE